MTRRENVLANSKVILLVHCFGGRGFSYRMNVRETYNRATVCWATPKEKRGNNDTPVSTSLPPKRYK